MKANEKFSLTKVQENMVKAQNLLPEIEKELRKMHGKKRLSKQQKEIAQDISLILIANEEPGNWKKKVSTYCKNPIDKNSDRVAKIQDIACEHQVDTYLASILYASKVE